MKTLISNLILFLITGMLAACTPAPATTTTIGEQDAGKTIELKTGDILVISLDGNISTGYNWIAAPQDPALLEQIGDPKSNPANDRLGSPGKIVLQFKAKSKGQTILRLDYKRLWEDTAPEKTIEVTVVVK